MGHPKRRASDIHTETAGRMFRDRPRAELRVEVRVDIPGQMDAVVRCFHLEDDCLLPLPSSHDLYKANILFAMDGSARRGLEQKERREQVLGQMADDIRTLVREALIMKDPVMGYTREEYFGDSDPLKKPKL